VVPDMRERHGRPRLKSLHDEPRNRRDVLFDW
jgi:hypothetical protein